MLPERTQRPTTSVEHDVREPAAEMGLARHAREDLGRRPIAVGPQDDLYGVLHRSVTEAHEDSIRLVEALDPSGLCGHRRVSVGRATTAWKGP